MGTKKQYIAPVLTVVTFKTEKGYAVSGPDPEAPFILSLFESDGDGYSAQGQQTWVEEDFSEGSW